MRRTRRAPVINPSHALCFVAGTLDVRLRPNARDAAFCKDAVEQTVQEFGRLDILVNNAAFQEHAESLEDVTEERFDETFRTNVYGYFHMARPALP